jgi:hypothetical protein
MGQRDGMLWQEESVENDRVFSKFNQPKVDATN